MTSLAQSDIFFFISSIFFVVFAIGGVILLVFCIRAVSSVNSILEKIDSNVDTIGDATKDLIDDLRHNVIFRMLFGPKKKKVHKIKK